MGPERPELRLVRESLEAVVAPTIVSSVIFEALEHTGGQLPGGPGAVRDLVDGALRDALARRLGGDAHALIDDVVALLDALTSRSAARAPTAPPPSRPDREVTLEVMLDERPVLVLVVAGSTDLATRLQAALGSARVTAIPTSVLAKLREQIKIGAPQLVLIDAADFAAIEPDELALELAKLPSTAVRAIWGADLPYGAALLRGLVERGAPATPFDRREGIDPMLDLIRSRRSAPSA